MDEIKDTERKDTISRFLSDKNIRTEAFGHNVSGERAYRRAERIVAALYLVTNHVSPDELLRTSVRESGLDLLSALLGLRDEMRSPESRTFKEVQTLIRKLMSFAQMLAAAGSISPQNASALVGALDELGIFLTTVLRTPLSESVELSREELVDVPALPFPPKAPPGTKGQIQRAVKDKRAVSSGGESRAEKNHTRSASILAILKAQGTLGIKDIAAHLPEYSEKMIQRELKSLVAAGNVRKSGSKRWSLYSLAR